MRILSIFTLTAAFFCVVSVTSTAVAKTEAREAMNICDKNPNCSYKVNDNGSVDLQVVEGDHINSVTCPQKGECQCNICDPPRRTGGKKGLKANVASTLTGGVVRNPSGGTIAKQPTSWNNSELHGVFDRNAVATACANAGGKSWSNLDSYGCIKENCDGSGDKDHTCSVTCQEATKKCTGQTPARLAGGKTLRQVLGVKVGRVASPPRDPSPPGSPSPPRKPSVLTGGNILDGGSGFGAQGPAATGSPSAGGKAPPPPPVKIY